MKESYQLEQSRLQNALSIVGNASGLQSGFTSGNVYDPYPVQTPPQYNYHYHSCGSLGCQICVSSPRLPRDTELSVELVGKECRLDYGGRLRSVIADPIKGHDIRDALCRLQAALREALSD
jgi:hypothetical protein